MQISNLQKLGLLGVLGLGIFIMGFAIARIIVTNKQGQHPEISWLALWSSIESSVAVIVCRLASFKTLFTAQKQQGSRQTYSQQGSKRGKIGSSAGRTLGSTAGRSRAKSIPLMSVRTAAPGDAQEAWMDDSSSQQEVLGDPLIHAK